MACRPHSRRLRFSTSFPLVFGSALLLAGAGPAMGAVISVCASGCDETVIQDAVDSASPGDTIFLPDSSYREAGIVVDVDVTFEGVEGMNLTLISAQGGTTYKFGEVSGRILTIPYEVTVTLRKLRFRNARVVGEGAVIRNQGHLVLENVKMNTNEASNNGGAIANVGGTLVLDGVTIGSSTSGGWGGGIYNASNSLLVARDCEISGGISAGQGGNVFNAGIASLRSCRLRDGLADRGGGLASSGDTWFSGLIDGNQARHGAGIHQSGGTMEVLRSEVSENLADDDGGGWYVGLGAATLVDSTVYANRADFGAGLFHTSSSVLRVRNSTINFNLARADGGGLLVDRSRHANLSSTTVAFNSADWNEDGTGRGGGLYLRPCSNRGLICVLSSATLRNTILSENWDRNPGSDTPDDCVDELTSDGYNLVGAGGTSVVFPCRVQGDLTGVQFGTDPDLLPLSSTSGGTPTHPAGSEPRIHPLGQDSAAIDAGDPAGCGDGQGGTLAADQRGGGRVGTCDLGAYERFAVPSEVLFADGFETGTTLTWW